MHVNAQIEILLLSSIGVSLVAFSLTFEITLHQAKYFSQ